MAFLLLVGSAAALAQDGISLQFIADLNIATGAEFFSLPAQGAARSVPAASQELRPLEERLRRKSSGGFGGISGVAYEPLSKTLYALSDSSKPTVFVLSLELADRDIRIAPKKVLSLSDAAGAPAALWTLDPEGIALSPEGVLFIASEGYAQRTPMVDPGVFRFDLEGRLLGSLPMPDAFLPRREGERMVGVRGNQGFESLSLSSGGGDLFVATEGGLAQDDADCDEAIGCTVRLLHYRVSAASDELVGEYMYRRDPPEKPDDFGAVRAIMGLSEILAVDDRTLLALERGYARAEDGRSHQVIRVYEVEVPTPPRRPDGPLEKRLVLDLASITGELSPGFQTLDNFEGMCLGPRLANGDRTLLMVSDNNYSERQRTSILAFRLLER